MINVCYILAILLSVILLKLYIENYKSNDWLGYLFGYSNNETDNTIKLTPKELADLHIKTSMKIDEAAEAGYIEGFAQQSEPESKMHSKPDAILDTVLTKSDSMKLMLFYKAGCPYCSEFLPTWYKIVNNLPNNVAYEEIEVDSGDNSRKLAGQYKVTSVPTVILLVNNVEKPYVGNRSYENISTFLKYNGINLVERSFDTFKDLNIPVESVFEPTKPQNKNCPLVTFDKDADLLNDKFYYQIFSDQGQYGYAVGGNKAGNTMSPFGAAYSVVDAYLTSLPDLNNPGKSTLKNASECANVYAKEIRNFGLCNKSELDKIVKYQQSVNSGGAKLRVVGTDYSSNEAVVNAIKSSCQL